MGGVPVKHHTKGKVRRRRSHSALKKVNLVVCQQCHGPKLMHRVCPQCGVHYNKRLKSTIKKEAGV